MFHRSLCGICVLLIGATTTTVVTGLALTSSGSRPCSAPQRLKQLLQDEMDGTRKSEMPILLPCCYDGLTARLVARAGFDATFMTGFGVSGELLYCILYSILLYFLVASIHEVIVNSIMIEFCRRQWISGYTARFLWRNASCG